MPLYTNEFLQKMKSKSPAPGETDTYYQQYQRIITHPDPAQLPLALSILDDASRAFRWAAANGDPSGLVSIGMCLRGLGAAVTKILKKLSIETTSVDLLKEIVVFFKPPSREPFVTEHYLFQPSTNGRNALSWALHQSIHNKDRTKNACEYAPCVAILLDMGFTRAHIPLKERDSKSPLFDFIEKFDGYSNAHTWIDFENIYASSVASPTDAYRKTALSKCMHSLNAHSFMQGHQKSLEAWVKELIERKIKKINVVEVGCGYTHYLPMMIHFFNAHNISVNYTGYDLNEADINENKMLYTNMPQGNKLTFKCENAMTLSKKEHQGKFDLVLFRHPEPLNYKFSDMFSTLSRHLINPAHGMLLISVYFAKEAHATCTLLALNEKAPAFTENSFPFIVFPGGLMMEEATNQDILFTESYQPDRFSLALTANQLLLQPAASASNGPKK